MSGWESIAVLDCGGPYTLQLVRRLRELGIAAALYPSATPPSELPDHVQGIIVSGSTASVHDADAPALAPGLIDSTRPVLGIGYGLQALNLRLGGKVARDAERRCRLATVEKVRESVLLQDLGQDETVWMSVGDDLTVVAPTLKVVARTREGRVAVVEDRATWRFGVQFHPEAVSTACGRQLLSNFAEGVCTVSRQWRLPDLVQRAGIELRRVVGDRSILVTVSGGLASMAATALLARCLPAERLAAVHVDTGLLRQGEADQVIGAIQALGVHRIEVVDAREEIRTALADADTLEAKNRRVAEVLATVARRVADRGGDSTPWQVWGSDYVEAPGASVDPLALLRVERDRLHLLPCLLQDEWRYVARFLGVPLELVDRSSLPTSGLAARCAGVAKAHRIDLLRRAEELVANELRRRGLSDASARIVCRLDSDPFEGGERLTIRLPQMPDGMREDATPMPWEAIQAIAEQLPRSLPAIGRVSLDVSSLSAGR